MPGGGADPPVKARLSSLAPAMVFPTTVAKVFDEPMVSKVPGFRRLVLKHSEVLACIQDTGAY